MNQVKRKKFNIIVLGESRVGKTSLVSTLNNKPFEEVGLLTAGIDFHMAEKEFEGQNYKFKIFDTAGQERYKSISKSSIKLADGIILVYSVVEKETFDKINEWIESIKEEVNTSQKAIILVGNKIDIENRVITSEEGENFAINNKFKYFETSAKTGVGVKEAFNTLYDDIFELNKQNLITSNIDLNRDNKKKKKCC